MTDSKRDNKGSKGHYLLLFISIMIGVGLLYYATWYVCSACPVPAILYGWVLFALLVVLIGAGYSSIQIKLGDFLHIQAKIEEAKKDIDNSLALFVPLIGSLSHSKEGVIKESINRLGGRKYIYELMTKVLSNSSYDPQTKLDLIKGCKWYLITELFRSLIRQSIIEDLKKENSKFEQKISDLNKLIKNGIPTIEYDAWLEKLEQLYGDNLITTLDTTSKVKYKDLIDKHNKILKKFIIDNELPNDFLLTGIL